MLPSLRRVSFASPTQKARWLDAACSLDAADPRVRALSRRFVESAKQRAKAPTPWQQVFAEDVFRFVRDSIDYRRDPGGREQFADAATILFRTGADDCDGKARTFVALIRAGGPTVEARIRPVMNERGDFVHVQAETRWPGSKNDPRTQANGWILAELILRDVALGQDPDTAPRDAHGKRVLAHTGSKP